MKERSHWVAEVGEETTQPSELFQIRRYKAVEVVEDAKLQRLRRC